MMDSKKKKKDIWSYRKLLFNEVDEETSLNFQHISSDDDSDNYSNGKYDYLSINKNECDFTEDEIMFKRLQKILIWILRKKECSVSWFVQSKVIPN